MLLYHPATGLAHNPLWGHTTDSKLHPITYIHTGKLDPSVRQLIHHLKNSWSGQPNVRDTKIKERDNLQSFNIVLLFTRVLLVGITAYMVTAEITDLSAKSSHSVWWHILLPHWWCCNGITPNFDNSQILHGILSTSHRHGMKKPAHWYIYLDDNCMVWSQRTELLHDFLEHMNNLHPNNKFVMELEQNTALLFLDAQ
jgi:hypothetical protein